MSVSYDLKKLRKIEKIDVDAGLAGCGSETAYFAELDVFVRESQGYLTKYNAYKVTTREEVRKWFFGELKRLRDFFKMVGLSDAILDLKYLEKAMINRDNAALEAELGEFAKSMDELRRLIAEAAAGAGESAESAGEKPLILAVDDMPGLLATAAKMLREQYNVIAVTSGAHALKVIEGQTPALFLLDIEMPEMNGYELAAIIRSKPQFESTPIIFLTAKSTRSDVITAIQYGGNDYIIKPVDKDMLLSKIARYLQ